jgi:hypothetical protein
MALGFVHVLPPDGTPYSVFDCLVMMIIVIGGPCWAHARFVLRRA